MSRLMTKPTKWPVHPAKTQDQPGHPPSLIRVFAVRMKKPGVLGYSLRAQWRLIRLGECPGWSESLQGAHVILLVLPCSISYFQATKNSFSFENVIIQTITVMILSFQTDRPRQTVQTQIRLLLEEQSNQGLHCLPFRLHRLDSLLCGRAT